MKRKIIILLSVLIILAAALPVAAGASPTAAERDSVQSEDFRMDPLTSAQLANKETAMTSVLAGKAYVNGDGKSLEVAKGQFVELAREGEDPIWTVLGEFNDFPHNNIAAPDRTVDNSTLWTEDFNQEYYQEMLFAEGKGVNSMRQWYIENSSNRYTVNGGVTDWVSLPGDACSYDDGGPGPGNALSVWQFIIDSLNGWYADQLADGKTPAEIDEFLSQYDVWDRYDWDGDGDFNEPDGYIDHMQFVHAGEGNEAGGGALGDCAIWSHSWFAYYNLIGFAGPSPDFMIGGVQIGGSSYWVNKYTIQPENGGVGVFAHEFGHDLGLPDLYDYTGENATGFWTVMSSGSWLSAPGSEDLGSAPNHFGVWEKFQLGWLNYEVAWAGYKSEHKLGPAEANTKQAQGLFVVLPDKEVTEQIAEPSSGSYFYYSGAGNNLDNTMTRDFTLPAGTPMLTAKVNFNIELDWDYAYLEVNGSPVETNFSTSDDPNSQNAGFGITGNSGGWQTLTADLSAFAGQTVTIGFRYWTDVAVVNPGFMVDDIQVDDSPLDDAESDFGWTFDGFRLTTGSESAFYSNYYVVEYRQYRGYDAGLANAYQFVAGNWVDHFSYQDGMLVSYWDNSFSDNNVGASCAAGRCGGLLLPVDAHPEALLCKDGSIWRNRIQTYDATFTLDPTDEITLSCNGQYSTHGGLPAVPVFDDNNSYYDPSNPMGSVITPITGTQIRIQSISAHGNFMQIQVRPSK